MTIKQQWRPGLSLFVVFSLIALLGWDFFKHLAALEVWIRSPGWIGWLAFIAVVAVLMSVFVPETLFTVMAGLMFGVVGGMALMVAAVLSNAALDFAIARQFLRKPERRFLATKPRLTTIQRAVDLKHEEAAICMTGTPSEYPSKRCRSPSQGGP